MTRFGTWTAYGSGSRLVVVLVMAAIAIGLLAAGWLVKDAELRPPPVRHKPLIVLLVAWVVSIVAFLVCLGLYAKQLVRDFPGHGAPASPILPVTLSAVVATFIVVLATRAAKDRAGVLSAVIAALAAPMVFELPFDLVVMTRTYPGLPPDPTLFRCCSSPRSSSSS